MENDIITDTLKLRQRGWNRTRMPNKLLRPMVNDLGFKLSEVQYVDEADDTRLLITLGKNFGEVTLSILKELECERLEVC